MTNKTISQEPDYKGLAQEAGFFFNQHGPKIGRHKLKIKASIATRKYYDLAYDWFYSWQDACEQAGLYTSQCLNWPDGRS